MPQQVMMSKEEQAMFEKYLDLPTTKTYYEYGSGGSTIVAAIKPNIEQVITVESDRKYYDMMLMSLQKVKRFKEKIIVHYVDVGCYDNAGYPPEFNFGLNYYTHIDKLEYVPDVILIDGRWRVECAFHVFRKATEDTIILLHDFEREEYKGIWACYDLFEVEGKLARIVKKKDEKIPDDAIFFFQFDPR